MRIITWRKDLLGGRLLNFAYAWALARLCGVGFRFGQPPLSFNMAQSNYDESDTLFSIFDIEGTLQLLRQDGMDADIAPDFVPTGPASVQRLVASHRKATDGEPLPAERITQSPQDLLFTSLHTHPIAGIDIGRWQAEARQLLRSLPLRPEVARALDQIRRAGMRGDIALHVRRGDAVTDLLKQGQHKIDAGKHEKSLDNFLMRFVPYRAYRRYLSTIPGAALSIFSDDPTAFAQVREGHCGRAFDATRAIQQLEGITKLQRDFVEIRFMADHATIVASQSRFAGVAAEIAGVAPVDLSAAGTIDEYLDELAETHGLRRERPAYGPLVAALRHRTAQVGQPQGAA